MQTLLGKASGIRHTVAVVGDRHGVATTHIAIFDLAGKLVQFDGSPAAINNGDEVEVAGDYSAGTFCALAYRNYTRRTRDTSDELNDLFVIVYLILGTAFPLFGVMAITDIGDLLPSFFGVVFIGIGMFLIYRAIGILRTRSALKKIRWSR
jgi:hypothetical protein